MICRTCSADKPSGDFYKEPRTKLGLRPHCKECILARDRTYTYRYVPKQPSPEVKKRWEQRNPDKVKAKQKRHNDKPEVKQRRRILNQTVRQEQVRAYVNRRRARLVEAEGSHSVTEWQSLVRLHCNACVGCGRKDMPLTRDHIIPLSRGGSDDISNIQPLCKPCNSAKGTLVIDFCEVNTLALNSAEA